MRAAVALLLALTSLAIGRPAGATPYEDLSRGEAYFSQGQYGDAVKALEPLVKPGQLNRTDDLVKAHLLLAKSYFFLDRKDAAKVEIRTLLRLDTTYELDPALEDAGFYSVFRGVRRDIQDQLDKIAEQRRLEEERRKRPKTMVIVERTYHETSTWKNWLPFGIPQLQRRQLAKGFAFLGIESAAGITSIVAFGIQAERYGLWNPRLPSDPAEQDYARFWRDMQWGANVVFFLTWGVGVWDAYRHQPPSFTETKREVPIKPTSRAPMRFPLVAPLVAPGDPRAKGLSLSWEF